MNTAQVAARACARLPVAPARKLAAYQLITRTFAPSAEKARSVLSARRLFLITSTGRTGTTWLATLLNTIDGVRATHEPVPAEQAAHAAALADPASAAPYVETFRMREIAWRLQDDRNAIYGEVNGALRRHLEALRASLPQLTVLHIVRHPRNVVASMLNRDALTPNDRIYRELAFPAAIDAARWQAMSRVERLCWLWSADNAYMRRHASGLAVFEDITQSYGSLREQVLDPLGLSLDEAVFDAHRNRGRNETRRATRVEHEWSDAEEAAYDEYCGAELAHYARYAGQSGAAADNTQHG
ncbi:MAG: hypothetical protein AAFN78_00055 [Pseudomonadota bacterium]